MLLMSGSSSNSYHGLQQQQQLLQLQEKKASELFAQRALQAERRLKPPDQLVACPRCQSLNTKFCYYNNYSLTQPRHFCKNCRRYWTAGGTLRNVPVGGGCRKNKRTKHSSTTRLMSTDAAAAAAAQQHSSAGNLILAAAAPHGSSGLDHQSKSDSPGAAAIAGLQQQQHSPFVSASSTLFDNNGHQAIAFEPSPGTCTATAADHMHRESSELPFGSSHTSTTLCPPPHHHQRPSHPQFESPGIMNLGLFDSVLPDTGLSMHSSSSSSSSHIPQHQQHHISSSTTGDGLSVFLDSSTYNRVGALAALSEGLNSNSSYNHHSSAPVSSGGGDTGCETLQGTARTTDGGGGAWRSNLPLPKQEPLWVEAEDSFLHGSLDLNRLHAKGKFLTPALFSHLPTHGLGEDVAAAAPGAAAWQQQNQQSAASQKDNIVPHYDFAPDTNNFWSNNSNSSPWSQLDLHALHGLGGGGSSGRLL